MWINWHQQLDFFALCTLYLKNLFRKLACNHLITESYLAYALKTFLEVLLYPLGLL